MKDDADFNVKFIGYVQERPCLYDFNRLDYCNKSVQDAAWQEIAKNVNESVTDCKEKWKNLRNSYARHVKRSTSLSGSAKYVKYYLADHLQFLEGFTKRKPPKSMSTKEDHKTNDADDLDDDKLESGHSESENFSEPDNFSKQISIKPKSKKVSLGEVNAKALEYFQSRKKMALRNENKDPDFAFLYSLLPDIKDMNQDQKRRFKIGVLTLVTHILQENIPASTNVQNTDSFSPRLSTDIAMCDPNPGSDIPQAISTSCAMCVPNPDSNIPQAISTSCAMCDPNPDSDIPQTISTSCKSPDNLLDSTPVHELLFDDSTVVSNSDGGHHIYILNNDGTVSIK